MSVKRVLSVGQCGADHAGLSLTIRSSFDADVIPADSAEEALTLLRDGDFDLVLVNRVFDWTGSSGVNFIGQLKADEALRSVPVMLVSNHDDAQREAVSRGALPGFGKAALGNPETVDRLRTILG
jgi:two-component system chemotaxis response regulator CheY